MSSKNTLNALPKSYVYIAWILVAGTMAPMLDTTMVNIALKQLSIDFQEPINLVQWTVTGFVLAMGASVPFSSWLVDRFSGKLVYFWSEIAFGIASLFAGLAWNIDILISLRLIQGFSAGLLMPIMFTLLVDLFGGDKMGRVMSIIGLPMTLGPMLGPIIGGFIIQYSSWRWMFFLNVPIVLIASWYLMKKVPAIKPKNPSAKFDIFGVLLLVTISISLVYGIVQASYKGTFSNTTTMTDIISGCLLIFVYIIYAHHKENAVLPLQLFSYHNFSGAMLANLLVGFITSGPMLLFPLFFQDVRHDSIIITAVALVPQSIGMLVSRGTIGRMIDHYGARLVVILGTLISVATTLPFAFYNASTANWIICFVMFIRGIGGAGVKSAIQADTFVGLPKQASGPASLGSKLFEQLGNALGSAVLATLIAGYINAQHLTATTQLIQAYHFTFAVTSGLSLLIIIPAMWLTNRLKSVNSN